MTKANKRVANRHGNGFESKRRKIDPIEFSSEAEVRQHVSNMWNIEMYRKNIDNLASEEECLERFVMRVNENTETLTYNPIRADEFFKYYGKRMSLGEGGPIDDAEGSRFVVVGPYVAFAFDGVHWVFQNELFSAAVREAAKKQSQS